MSNIDIHFKIGEVEKMPESINCPDCDRSIGYNNHFQSYPCYSCGFTLRKADFLKYAEASIHDRYFSDFCDAMNTTSTEPLQRTRTVSVNDYLNQLK